MAKNSKYNYMSESRIEYEKHLEVGRHMKKQFGAKPKQGNMGSYPYGFPDASGQTYKAGSKRYRWQDDASVQQRKKYSRADAKKKTTANKVGLAGTGAFAVGATYALAHTGLNGRRTRNGAIVAGAGAAALGYHIVQTHKLDKKYPWKRVGTYHPPAHDHLAKNYYIPEQQSYKGTQRAMKDRDRRFMSDAEYRKRYGHGKAF